MNSRVSELIDEAQLLRTEHERCERIKADLDALEEACMNIIHDELIDLPVKKFMVETRIRFYRAKYPSHPSSTNLLPIPAGSN